MLDTFLVVGGLSLSALALADLAGRLAIYRFERLDPEQIALPGRRFWLRGIGIHYRDRGSGPAVLLIHGFGGSTFSFRYLERSLATHFRVLSVDLPGFGYSDRSAAFCYSRESYVKLLVEFLGRLGIDRVHLVGHSFGGVVVQQFAAEHPALVDRVVLAGSTSSRPRRGAKPGRIAIELAVIFQGLMAQFPALYRALGRSMPADPAYFSAAIAEAYHQPLQVRGTAAAHRRLMASLVRDQAVDLRSIGSPVLLLRGERDKVVKPAVAAEMAADLPDARIVEIPAAGHLVLEEQPLAAERAVLDFLLAEARPPAGTEQLARATR